MLLVVIRIGGVLAARDNNTHIKNTNKTTTTKAHLIKKIKKKSNVTDEQYLFVLFLYAWLQRIILPQCGHDNRHF